MNCRTSPGADIGSDHNPVIMKMNLKLKKPNKKTDEIIKYDMTALTDILPTELESALHPMRNGKASGIDNISKEMLQAMGDFGINILTEMCNKMTMEDPADPAAYWNPPKMAKIIRCFNDGMRAKLVNKAEAGLHPCSNSLPFLVQHDASFCIQGSRRLIVES
ncbi:hypothetical protein ElyMa_005087800 [Elysia marginata]|uniref:Reverse transcriptase domain-containing protein n=1 Tax=Elysia marginata TaxID=1093978 RepID=A0AAV4JM22_9GAST|nr:hypothetical protein ElyMa_005087800 [Elysia marginata]